MASKWSDNSTYFFLIFLKRISLMLCNSFTSKKLTFSPELSEILLNIVRGFSTPMSLDALIGRRIDSTDLIRIMQTNATDQISYYNQLKKIPNLDPNVPENISIDGDDILIRISPDGPRFCPGGSGRDDL